MSKALKAIGLVALGIVGVVIITAISGSPMVFFRAYKVSSASMEDTLTIGERILVRQYPRPELKFADIVVVISPMDRKEAFIKRVVGLPGDHIRIVNRVMVRNGKPQAEPYAKFVMPAPDPTLDNFPGAPSQFSFPGGRYMLAHYISNGELVVPAKSYFVLGDNREDSLDDRLTGVTPAADVIGKAIFTYMGGSVADGKWFRPL